MAPAHPLRRISTGSLSSLARSQDRQHASPSGLEFLQPALMELTDEAATLASNTQQLNELHDALGTFNESFAGYLYALKMNAFCVEWKQAPDESTFARLATLFPPQQPEPIMFQPSQQTLPPSPPSDTHQTQPNPADMTYATAYSSSHDDMPPSKPAPPAKRVVSNTAPSAAAKKAALAAKKKREEQIGSYIEMLPLEYRGSQPSQRIAMEKLIGKLMVNPSGLATGDLVSPPDLPQAKVNKCLIALVAKKLVSKESVDGRTSYRWVGA